MKDYYVMSVNIKKNYTNSLIFHLHELFLDPPGANAKLLLRDSVEIYVEKIFVHYIPEQSWVKQRYTARKNIGKR